MTVSAMLEPFGSAAISPRPQQGDAPMSSPEPIDLAQKALADIEQISLTNLNETNVERLQAAIEQIHAIARYRLPVLPRHQIPGDESSK
jgi:hypothetical protein